MTTKSEPREKECLCRVGRTSTKTHHCLVTYVVVDEGKPWEKRTITDVAVVCSMMGGVGRMYSRGVTPFFSADPKNATCEHCGPTA